MLPLLTDPSSFAIIILDLFKLVFNESTRIKADSNSEAYSPTKQTKNEIKWIKCVSGSVEWYKQTIITTISIINNNFYWYRSNFQRDFFLFGHELQEVTLKSHQTLSSIYTQVQK